MNFIQKNLLRVALCICIAFAAQSCVVHTKTKTTTPASTQLPPGLEKKEGKPLPPGQAKKVTGSQSAKEYAPGQQKKK